MEGFCGGPLWNTELYSNRTTSLGFTNCFKQTILIYVPCAFLWISLFYECYRMKKISNLYIPWNFLNIGKLILCFFLLTLNVVELSLVLYESFSSFLIYPVRYITPFIKACTYCLALALILLHRKKGIHTSGTLFVFWALLSIYTIINYRLIFLYYWSNVIDAEYYNGDERSYIFKTLEFPLIFSQFFLSFFSDLRSQFISPGEEINNVCPRNFSSFPSQLIFQWATPFIKMGYKKNLKQNDLWNLNYDYSTDYVLKRFSKFWNNNLQNDKNVQKNILKSLFRTFWLEFLFLVILKVFYIILMFAGPLILDRLITFASSNDPNWKGYFLAFLLFCFTFLESMTNSQYEFYLGVLGMKIKTCLISTVYKKALVLSTDGRNEYTTGQIVNFMSVDVQRIVDYIQMFNIVWSAPIQIVVCLVLLWQKLGVATLAGMGTMIILIPLNAFYTSMMKKVQSSLMKQKDVRTKLMDELLNGIKIIKLCAWEIPFKNKISKIREQEVVYLNKSALYTLGIAFVFSCTTFLVSLVSFTTYVLIDSNNVLTANKAFVTLSLLNLLRIPFALLPISIMYGAIAFVSFKRIMKFLNCDELDIEPDVEVTYKSEIKETDYAIEINDGIFSWGKNEEPCLRDVNLKIKKNSLVAIVGKVGSGKSSLLSSILKDIFKKKGDVTINGSVSYVPQCPFIRNETIRENITLFNPLNQTLYDKVIKICALTEDLKIFKAGDNTEIGEKGINLSGGQKQRVSLARACYNDADIFVLDDPLSAVDSQVGKHIFDNVIGPNGFLKNKTKVLVTHNVTILSQVDQIIVLKNGKISEQGSYNELINSKGEFSEILNLYANEKTEDENDNEKKENSLELSMIKKSLENLNIKKSKKDKNEGKLVEEEKQATGSVKFYVYKDFIKSMGLLYVVFTILGYIGLSAFNLASNLWLTAWSNDSLETEKVDIRLRNLRIGGFAGFGFLEAFFSLFAAVVLNFGLIQASKSLHTVMLDRLLRAPMQFFDTTPTGRILNRFSKDLDTADLSLRFNFRILLNQFFRAIISIIVFCIETPIFLIVALPIAIFYLYIQKLYIMTSRQLKRIESTTRSPIYSHFSETVQGSTSIRAYGISEKFSKECHRLIDNNNTATLSIISTTRWLTVRLEFLGYIIVFLTAVFAVIYRDTLNPGLAGLVISFALNFTSLISSLIKNYSDVENNIVAVERCLEYSKIDSEAPTKSALNLPGNVWPSKGVIKFKNYSTAYRKGLTPVLNNLTVEMKSNEKVGIVGRTGAGKSSLTLGLFRIIEATTGKIEIDDVDISTLGLDDLRSRLTIIPQDPFLYSDTLLANLDPLNQYTDDQIWKALEQANLKDFVDKLTDGLMFAVTEGGENLSVGQRQLVCLARALLRKTKILILDEATAAIDFETDNLIQDTIRKEFKDCTVLTIAHRLNTIIDYDKVLVLSNGKLVEFDNPKALLENPESQFYSLAKESGLISENQAENNS